MKQPALVLLVCLAAALVQPTNAEDWPAWRGANRDGICHETGLLKDWPDDGPTLLWQTKGLGEGYSGPAIVGNILYTMGNRDGNEMVMARDVAKKGDEIWTTAIGTVRHKGDGYPGPRATPTIDGNRLYTLGINGDLVCMDIENGKIVWKKDFVKDFGGQIPGWGYSESVLIDGTKLICTPGMKKATMAALNKKDGTTVWTAAIGDPAAYSSPVKLTVGDVKQYVTLTAKGVIAVAADDGTFCWRYNRPANGTANVTTCVAYRQTVFGASAYGTGGGLALVQQTADGFTAKELYFTKKMKNHHGGVILLDGFLYGADDNKLTCLDYKTGDVKWSDRSCGKCSLLCADGRLYCRDEKGPISLVEATSRGFKLHGRFEQPSRSNSEAWSHLVISDGKLYVRDQDVLLCYEVK